MSDTRSPYLALILFVFLSLTWGSSYILIKRALVCYGPVELAGLRVLIASTCLLLLLPQAIPKIPRSKWKYLVFPGWIGAAIPALLYAHAQTQLDSAITGILSAMTPLMTLLLGLVFFRLQILKLEFWGVALGLLGAIFIILGGVTLGEIPAILPALLVLGGTFCYALSTNAIFKWLHDYNPIHISSLAFAFVFPFALVSALMMDWADVVSRPCFAHSTLAVVALSFFGTVVASVLFFRLVQISGPALSSMVSYFIPIVALMLGLWDGESLKWSSYLGMILIIAGVYVTRQRKKKKAPHREASAK